MVAALRVVTVKYLKLISAKNTNATPVAYWQSLGPSGLDGGS